MDANVEVDVFSKVDAAMYWFQYALDAVECAFNVDIYILLNCPIVVEY
jgi:hypothetical protein